MNLATPGDHRCQAHGGVNRDLIEEKHSYQLNAPWLRERVAELGKSTDPLSMRKEVLIAKVLLEEALNEAGKSRAELLRETPRIHQLFQTIEKLTKTTNQIDRDQNQVLHKDVILALGTQIGKVLAEELRKRQVPGWEEIVDCVNVRIIDGVVLSKNVESE